MRADNNNEELHRRLDNLESKLEKLIALIEARSQSEISQGAGNLRTAKSSATANKIVDSEATVGDSRFVDAPRSFLADDDDLPLLDPQSEKETALEWNKDFIRSIAAKRHYEMAKYYCPYPSPFPKDLNPSTYDPRSITKPLTSNYQYYRACLYHFMHDESFSTSAEYLEYFVFALIILSSIAYIFSTVESYDTVLWEIIEVFVSICFTIEYFARIVSVKNLHIYVIQPLNLIDLVAVLPWYVEKATGVQGAGLRVLRVIRLCRVFRLRTMMEEYTEIISRAIGKTIAQSSGMVSLIILLELAVCSSLMYVIEKDQDSGFDSIPISMYWCMVTITTVGYGDMYPVSDLGRFLACVTMFTGLIVIACVVIMFGGNFEDSQTVYTKKKEAYIVKMESIRTNLSE